MMMELTKRLVVPAAEDILDKYFQIHDYGFISLKNYSGGDKSIERAARCSYNFEEENRSDKDTENLIRYLSRNKHSSPFEQTSLTFHVGLPIFVARQLFRHRTLKINELSGRYSILPLSYYTPPPSRLKVQSLTNKQGSGEAVSSEIYQNYLSDVEITREKISDLYKSNLEDGIAKELARLDLPVSLYTYCYIEIDLRNLFHLISLRSEEHAQSEIRDYSDIFGAMAKRVAPLSTQAFLDYQFNSVTFSYAELEALRQYDYYRGMFGGSDPETKKATEKILIDNKLTKREVADFWKKLETKSPKDFNLDLSQAKDGDFFYNIIKQHQIEVPTDD
jgi:thymidylate synthase (FAD)